MTPLNVHAAQSDCAMYTISSTRHKRVPRPTQTGPARRGERRDSRETVQIIPARCAICIRTTSYRYDLIAVRTQPVQTDADAVQGSHLLLGRVLREGHLHAWGRRGEKGLSFAYEMRGN